MSTAVVASTTSTTNREALDNARADNIADQLRNLKFGSLLAGQFAQQLRRMVPATDSGSPSGTAVQTIKLDGNRKASRVLRAYCRAGGAGIPGELVPDSGAYAAPASTHITVQPNGDIAVLTADAITDLDIEYIPERGDVVTLPQLPVVGNAIVLPAALTAAPLGVVLLLSAVAIAGTGTLGPLRVNGPAAANATNGVALLNLAKSSVLFSTGGDAFTQAQVSLLVCTAQDLATFMSAQQATP